MYKETSAFVNFLLYDSAFKHFTDAIFALSLHTFIKTIFIFCLSGLFGVFFLLML